MQRRTPVTKVSDVKDLVAKGKEAPRDVLPEVKELAASDDWKVREVAATTLVEISKRHPDVILGELSKWAKDGSENVRRASSEGLRGLARVDIEKVLPILVQLKADSSLYVKKSVANLLRDGSKRQPDVVLSVAADWARTKDPNTLWIVSNGLKKIAEARPSEVKNILGAAHPPAPAAKKTRVKKRKS